jgi:peptidoglycan/LPS O-acetylase OafA/YrhL
VYFPNLNGLRFLAAILVIIHHIEQIKSISRIENYWESSPFVGIIGKLGVILFFVLSGFLITYLLLAEENSLGQISVKKFYIRRILRIWPLYFLVISLAFIILPNIDLFILPGFEREVIYTNLFLKLTLYVLFLPNLVLSLIGIVPYASHTWSIGTEEQFYLVWPIIIKYFKKNRITIMILIILFYVGFELFINSSYSSIIPFNSVIREFWYSFNIDCMAIGGIYAIILFTKSSLLKIIQNQLLFYLIILSVTFFIIKGVYIPYVHNEFYAILFGILILNFASNPKIKNAFENPIFNYLGSISYGLYMYHPIGIVLALQICEGIKLSSNWMIYPLSLSLTIGISAFSFKYFESYFLKFKHKFSIIQSGRFIK